MTIMYTLTIEQHDGKYPKHTISFITFSKDSSEPADSNTTRTRPAKCFTGADMASTEVLHFKSFLLRVVLSKSPHSPWACTRGNRWIQFHWYLQPILSVIWSQSICYSNSDRPDVINKLQERPVLWLYSPVPLPYTGASAHQQVKERERDPSRGQLSATHVRVSLMGLCCVYEEIGWFNSIV